MRRATLIKIAVLAAGGACLGIGGLAFVPRWYSEYRAKQDAATNAKATAETVRVVRQDLVVLFTANGRLRAIQSVPIIPQINNRQLRITWLAEEGASVKKGDKLVTFDTNEIEQQQREAQQRLDESKQQAVVAQAAVDIQISDSKSTISTAEAALKTATTDFNTYRDLDAPKRLNEIEQLVNENRKKLAEAKQAVIDARQKLDDQLFGEEEARKQAEHAFAEAQQEAETTSRILDSNTLQKKIFRQYEYPQQLSNKKQAMDSADLGVAKAKITGDRALEQRKAELKRYQNAVDECNMRLKQLSDEKDKSTISAPVDGLVVYGDPDRGQYYGGDRITVGAQWYGGNVLMTIPDLSAFEIDINVPEDYRGRLSEGVNAVISFDAVPGISFAGKVKEIARLGQVSPYSFDDGSGTAPRNFKTKISLDGADKRLVSGMSAKVEITCDVVKDPLIVPVDALFNDNSQTVAYVKVEDGKGASHLEKRRVRTGKRNDSYTVVEEGLSEGMTLQMVEPPDAGAMKPVNALSPVVAPTTEPVTGPAPTTAPSPTTGPTALMADARADGGVPTTMPTTMPTTAPAQITPTETGGQSTIILTR